MISFKTYYNGGKVHTSVIIIKIVIAPIKEPVFTSFSLGICPVAYTIAVDGAPTGVMNAIVADNAVPITNSTGLVFNKFAIWTDIGISIAAVALFEMKFVKKTVSMMNNNSIKIIGIVPCNEAKNPPISEAAPETVIALPNRIPPPTMNINSHWIDLRSFMSSRSSPNITSTESMETIATLEIEGGNPIHTSIWLPKNQNRMVVKNMVMIFFWLVFKPVLLFCLISFFKSNFVFGHGNVFFSTKNVVNIVSIDAGSP